MKKKLLKLICLVAASVCALTAAFGLPACKKSSRPVVLLEENIIEDKYDNYYEIFVYSFCDSDGDGYGDFNGITSKLDYIRDMGYTGIWLMPINPCSSYHGYDVTDYCAVNDRFGTMEDYKNLLSSAHEKGVKVIIDLVINHTSSQHPWFQQALGGNAMYKSYYNFSTVQQDGYNQKNGLWYESWFSPDMPDLNLKSSLVRGELEKIMKFWLEMGTDGFRLDGCKFYYPSMDDSVEFCKWIQDTAEKYNENAYIVGEMWSGRSDIESYYASGVDSFFYFDTAGNVRDAINTNSADEIWVGMKKCAETSGEYISAPFLSNHDNGVGRFAGRVSRNEDKIKFGFGLMSMYSGCTFTYYGDEIGMIGAHNDPDLRIGMLWDNAKTNITLPPIGTQHNVYAFDGVEEQLKNPNSILNYYKKCNNARNAFPSLMRGKARLISTDDSEVLAFTKTYGDEVITVVINFGDEAKTVPDMEGGIAQQICTSGKITKDGTTLKMPAYSISILK